MRAPVCSNRLETTPVPGPRKRLLTAAVVATVTEEVFEKLCFGERTGGVLAIAQTPVRSLDRLQLPATPQVRVRAIDASVQLAYLSGGGAGGHTGDPRRGR